jgi:hypothetical protein
VKSNVGTLQWKFLDELHSAADLFACATLWVERNEFCGIFYDV